MNLKILLELLFPKNCVGCKRFGTFFCPDCISGIKQTELICPFCERLSLGGITHPVCRRKYGLDGLWSLGVYEDPLKTAIQKLKYKWVQELADDLIKITIEYWAKHQPFLLEKIKKDQGRNWVIVPVPLHKLRQNWRGFNQASLLGKMLSNASGIKFTEALTRVKYTKIQMKLHARERRINIKGAFQVSNLPELKGKSIIIVDDVWTTGATIKECCFELKRSGAKEVWGLTIAK